jgi:hypothetical protein
LEIILILIGHPCSGFASLNSSLFDVLFRGEKKLGKLKN